MSNVFSAATTPTAADERKREEPARERARSFARRIDCTPDAAVAPKRGRAGRGTGVTPGTPPAGVEERRARRNRGSAHQ